ncbi:copper resistance D family protein [Deinococcus hohokamensis]|uniref:Copper resistance D family protein n=1 Tax=Deinococcus hohokamensis TaxID=309883 RepID=A0ABV9I2W2_9DEIO
MSVLAGVLLYVGLALLLGGSLARRALTPGHPGGQVLGAGLALVVAGTGLTLGVTLTTLGFTAPADVLAYLTQTATGRALVLMLMGTLILLASELSAWPLGCTLAAAALALWGLAGAGHGAVHGPAVRFVHALHAGAMCGWLGGVTALLTLRGATTRDAQRFTPLATACVCTLAVTGVVATVEHAGTLWGVWESPYGRVLMVKLGLVAVTLLAALWVRRTFQLARSPQAQLAMEVALLVAVLGATAVLSNTSPPTHDMPQMEGH